jgi:Zn-dependent metalloprotease
LKRSRFTPRLLVLAMLCGISGFQNLASAQETLLPVPPTLKQTAAAASSLPSFQPSGTLPGDPSIIIGSDSELLSYLTDKPKMLGIASWENPLRIIKKETDSIGKTHYLLQQQYKGLPVYGKYIRAHLNSSKQLYALTNQTAPGLTSLGLDINPAIDPGMAAAGLLASIEQSIGASVKLGGTIGPRSLTEPQTELLIYPSENQYHLAYQIRLEYADPSFNSWTGFVDAKTGAVLHKFSRLTEAAATGTGKGYLGETRTLNISNESDGSYRLIDKTKPMYRVENGEEEGYLAVYDYTRPFSGPISNNVPYFYDAPAVDAHYYAGIVYDYYKDKLQRNSIDGKGMSIISVVNAGAIDNAAWDGYEMLYGDGTSTFGCLSCSLDIVAHELTHGVTQYTADLEYIGQSGALNESMSDIMAAVIDADDWTIGEETGVTEATYVLRDLRNPSRGLTPQPSHMNDYVNLPLDHEHDNGGIHTNSGIPNHAAYLIGTGIEQVPGLQGHGKTLLGQIAYRALTSYLTPTSQFADARDSFVLAAGDLNVTDSQKAAIVEVVKNAWAAVGLPYTNDENNIVAFHIPGMIGSAVIDPVNHTVDFTLPYNACLKPVTPSISVSPGAVLVTEITGSEDYNTPKSYTVRSQSGLLQTWTVRGTMASAVSYNDILAFSVMEQTGEALINQANRTVTFYTESAADLSAVTPFVEASAGAVVSPASGARVDLSGPLTYTVTAQNGTTAVWTIQGIKDSASPKLWSVVSNIKNIIELRFSKPMNAASLTQAANYSLEPLMESTTIPQVIAAQAFSSNGVLLTATGLESNMAYKVTVSNVQSSDWLLLRPDRNSGLFLVGDHTPPELLTARVEGDELELTYDDYILSMYSTPSFFQVKVNGSITAVNSVVSNARTVKLTLAAKVRPQDTILLSYTPNAPYSGVFDRNSNVASGFLDKPVINRTIAPAPFGEPGRFYYPGTVKQVMKHPSKPIIYSIFQGDKHVVSANLATGATASIELDYLPERLFATEDELFVALVHKPHSSYWWEESQSGSLAVLNGTDLTLKDEFTISTDPFDLAVDGNGYIYVASGSGQWSEMHSYSKTGKNAVNKSDIYEASYMQLNRTLSRIYTINTNLSPRDIRAYNFDSSGRFTDPHYPGGYDSPYHGDYPMTTLLRISPDDQYLFNGAGTVFTSTYTRSADMNYVRTIDSFSDIAFELSQDRFYTLKDNKLTTWKYSTFEKGTSVQLTQPVSHILSTGQADSLYLVAAENGGKRTSVITYHLNGPAPGTTAPSYSPVDPAGTLTYGCAPAPATGGGGGGGGGGGFFGGGFIGGAPAQEPAAPTQTLGKDALQLDKKANSKGTMITTVTPDSKKLLEVIQSAQAGFEQNEKDGKPPVVPTIEIPVQDFGEGIRVEVPLNLVFEANQAAPTAVIAIKSGSVAFDLPVKLLSSDSLKRILGDTIDFSNATITVALEKLDATLNGEVQHALAADGFTPISDSIDFKLLFNSTSGTREISDFDGLYVRRSFTLPASVSAGSMTVLVYDPIAKEFSFIPAVSRTGEGGTIMEIMSPHNSIYTVVKAAKTFSDIRDHWAKADIELLASRKIIQGVSEQSFIPEKQITRAEFAAILVRALGLPMTEGASRFQDVQSTDWFFTTVNTAARAGLVSGISKGEFNPGGTITRQEMAVMIGRATRYAGSSQAADETIPTKFNPDSFSDWGSISAWASSDITKLIDSGILNGVTADTFEPLSPVTRAQAATVLKRMLTQLHFIN